MVNSPGTRVAARSAPICVPDGRRLPLEADASSYTVSTHACQIGNACKPPHWPDCKLRVFGVRSVPEVVTKRDLLVNKTEFVETVAARAEVSQPAVHDVIDAALMTIQDALAQGHAVTLPGFGTFTVTDRAARAGRNPRTGEALVIPATRYPRFAAGTALRSAVRGAAASAVAARAAEPSDLANVNRTQEPDMSKSKKKKDDKKKKKGKKKK